MGVASAAKKLVIFLVIFALLIGSIVIVNFSVKSLNGSSGSSDGGGDKNPPASAYYYEGAEGTIDFDFSEPGILYDDGVVKYEAIDGYLAYEVNPEIEAGTVAQRHVVFPLMRDGSALKISDYSEITISLEVIPSDVKFSIGDDYYCEFGLVFDKNAEKVEMIADYGYFFSEMSQYYGFGCPGMDYLTETGDIQIHENDDGVECILLEITINVDEENPLDSKYWVDFGADIDFDYTVLSEYLYGVSLSFNTGHSEGSVLKIDNFKVTTKN